MGQYHYIVNLDRKEYLNPHQLGIGLKAWEQIASHPSTPDALFMLLTCSNGRGGGDFAEDRGQERVIGRWSGDRIAVVGDYAENGDIRRPTPHPVSNIYRLCGEGRYREISEWVRPLLAAELGVKYVARPWRVSGLDGKVTRHVSWDVQRDPRAPFSVLGPAAE